MPLDSLSVFLSIGLLGAGVALLLQRSGSRRAASAAQARCEALLAERAMLARGLQDTLLQRFTGITLQIDGVRQSLRQQANPLAGELARILDHADQVLAEARQMIGVSASVEGIADR
jgi:signal transduction histidine kinase